MSDKERGKRMNEEMIVEQIVDSLARITDRTVTDEWEGDAEQVEGSPDFIVGLDGQPFGLELTEVRGVSRAWDYFEEASRLAWKKHASYERRGLFRFPIALAIHSSWPALFHISKELEFFGPEEFDMTGFTEVWAVDFSDAYFTPGDPFRQADMFCFKPAAWFGFHRTGFGDKKPFG
jgi:hypothetical protein